MMDREMVWLIGLLAVLIAIFGVLTYVRVDMAEEARSLREAELELIIRQAVREEVRHELEGVREDYQRMAEEDRELIEQMREWLEEWQVATKEITYYAPLDDSAVEGQCYSGNPNITASGARVDIGTTVAAGPDIPFGTKVYIDGLGWRTVADRGGAIGNENLDVAVWSRETALSRGREQRLAVIERN